MLTYLASPYYSDSGPVVAWRAKRTIRATLLLLQAGVNVFSPIAYNHQFKDMGLELDHAGWMKLDLDFLHQCGRLLVLTLPGWLDSKGVGIEVREAAKMGIPVAGCDVIPEAEPVSGRDILKHFGVAGGKAW